MLAGLSADTVSASPARCGTYCHGPRTAWSCDSSSPRVALVTRHTDNYTNLKRQQRTTKYFSFLRCSDIAGWVTGRVWATYPKGFVLKKVKVKAKAKVKVKVKDKGKGRILIQCCLHDNRADLGSGSWSARANGAAAQYEAIYCPR